MSLNPSDVANFGALGHMPLEFAFASVHNFGKELVFRFWTTCIIMNPCARALSSEILATPLLSPVVNWT